MDTSLFSQVQTGRVAAAHVVGTSLVPKTGAASNVRTATGATALASNGKTAAAATGSTGSASTPDSAASATADGATITSSDFLTLLVTELQNQDPTQPTDPNEYISQLVGVNSLEQLIAINSGVSALGSSATTSTGTSTGSAGSVQGVSPTVGGVAAGTAIPAESAVPDISTGARQHTRASGTSLTT